MIDFPIAIAMQNCMILTNNILNIYPLSLRNHSGAPLDNISEAVGNTPLVKISDKICPAGRTIQAKAEYFNPLSSVKDRLALAIIEAAEKDGTLKPGQTVVEATSGNTGIGRQFELQLFNAVI